MILFASSSELLHTIIGNLRTAFAVKDLGPVISYFLGVDVQRTVTGFILSQASYAADLLQRAGMTNCKPAPTPADTKPKSSRSKGDLISNPSWYRSMVGALQYLTLTRPGIAYAVQQVCLHMHAPRTSHATLLKRVLRYVKGTTTLGLHLHGASARRHPP